MTLNVVFVIWREFFEAILVVSIVHGFLSRQLPPAAARRITGIGIALGVGLSVALGAAFQVLQTTLSADTLDHFQTAMLLACAAFMTHMCLWMQRHGKTMKRELEHSLAGALTGVNRSLVIGLVALAIAREGFEMVVFLYGMGVAAGLANVVAGGALGLLLAAISGLALVRGFRFVNPRLLFKLTGGFLLLTAGSLVIAAAGRLMQAGLLPPLVDQVWDTSAVLDDQSTIGRAIAGITGYQSSPALLTVLAYGLYWILYGAGRWAMQPRAVARPATAAALVALLGVAAAHSDRAAAVDLTPVGNDTLKTKVSGYGDLQFAYFNYSPDDTFAGVPKKDARAAFDTTRFAAELEGFYLPYNVAFELEVEFEHGGTGAAKEAERTEQTYDNDVEKGGEVMLEEFYLKKYFTSDLTASAGRIMVGVGLLSLHNRPIDYLGVQRPEAEVHLIPEAWNEMGAELDWTHGDVHMLAQVVNGLDSSRFGSEYWVAAGQQGAFEQTNATDLAGVLRLDYAGLMGTVLGVSGYYGGTSRDRPPGRELTKTGCAHPDTTDVAPCGYINAPLLIADVHVTVTLERLRGSGDVIWGRLQNAGRIFAANADLPEPLDATGGTIADQALGYWAEAGYDIGPNVGLAGESRLEPFLRYDYYNTMYKVSGGALKNPRYERRVDTAGVSYTASAALFAKFDVSQRSFADKSIPKETTVETGIGFLM